MIKINQNLTQHDIQILNASLKAAMPDINSDSIHWHSSIIQTANGNAIPVVIGVIYSDDNTPATTVCVKGTIENNTIQLHNLVIDGKFKSNFRFTPLNEIGILSAIPEPDDNKPKTHSQLSACSKLIQELYADNDEYSIDKPVPKLFFSILDMDYYFSKLAVTMEESILLWMESTGRLSVNMDDDEISVSKILQDSVKRIFMNSPARNKVSLELTNGSIKDFSQINPSVQVEICREILSILL